MEAKQRDESYMAFYLYFVAIAVKLLCPPRSFLGPCLYSYIVQFEPERRLVCISVVVLRGCSCCCHRWKGHTFWATQAGRLDICNPGHIATCHHPSYDVTCFTLYCNMWLSMF